MGNTYWKICEMLNKNAYLNIIILYFAGQSLYYFFLENAPHKFMGYNSKPQTTK